MHSGTAPAWGLGGGALLAAAAWLAGALPSGDPAGFTPGYVTGLVFWVAGAVVVSLAWLRGAGWWWLLPVAFAPPLGSRDVYAYACQGWLWLHDLDPYRTGVADGGCPWTESVPQLWWHTPTPYGPFALALSGLAAATGTHIGAVIVLRAIAVAAVAALVWQLPKLAHHAARERSEGEAGRTEPEAHQTEHTTGGAEHTAHGAEHTTREIQHTTGEAEHTTGEAEHIARGAEHAARGAEHTTRETQHTTGEAEHATGEAEHTTGGVEHTTGGAEHATGGAEHPTGEAEHATRGAEHTDTSGGERRADEARQALGAHAGNDAERATGRARQPQGGFGPRGVVVLGVLTPLVAIHGVSGAHNDVLVAAAIVGALVAGTRRMGVVAGLCLAAAVGIKVTAAVAVPFVLILLARRWWHAALAGAGAFTALTLATGLDLGWLNALRHTGELVQWSSLPTAVGMAFGYLIGPQAVTAARIVGLIILAAIGLWALRHAWRGHPITACGVMLAATVLLGPVFYPWYAIAPLAVLAALNTHRKWLIAATLVCAFLTLPNGHGIPSMTKAVGAYAVTAALIWAAVHYRRTPSAPA